jgi:hypothetical protein
VALLEAVERPFLMGTDRAAVPSHVGGQDRCLQGLRSVHASLVGHGDVGAVLGVKSAGLRAGQ